MAWRSCKGFKIHDTEILWDEKTTWYFHSTFSHLFQGRLRDLSTRGFKATGDKHAMHKHCSSLSSLGPGQNFHPELRFPPHDMYVTFLLPVEILVDHIEVIGPMHFRQYKVHLHVCKATSLLIFWDDCDAWGYCAYLRPRQPRGPSENG